MSAEVVPPQVRLVAPAPEPVWAAQWHLGRTLVRLEVADVPGTDPDGRTVARVPRRAVRRMVAAELRAIDRACGLFRHGPAGNGSELDRVAQAAGRRTPISPLLVDLIRSALRAAELTDGTVDPTVGNAVIAARPPAGALVPVCGNGPGVTRTRSAVAGPRSFELDAGGVRVPAGVCLDLSATARGFAADRCAEAVVRRWGVAARVTVGSVTSRRTPGGGREAEAFSAGPAPAAASPRPIIDPRTAAAVPLRWRSTLVVAPEGALAQPLALAGHVLGPAALPWFVAHGVTARLVTVSGQIITTEPGADDGSARPVPVPRPVTSWEKAS